MERKGMMVIAVALVVLTAAAAVWYADRGQDDHDLSVVYLNKAGYETQMIADEKGFFSDAGVRIKNITVSGSGQDAVNVLLSGNADIAATGAGPAATTLNKHRDEIVVVAGVECSTGGHVWVAGPNMTDGKRITEYDKDSDNKDAVRTSFENAKNSLNRQVRIGVQKGSSTETELKLWLKAMDVIFTDLGSTSTSETVKLIDNKANTLVSVIAAGQIDILAASQPFPDIALSDITGTYRIGDSADIDSYGVSMYITTKGIYEKKEEQIKRFIQGLKRASDHMVDPDNKEDCVRICAERMGVSEQIAEASFLTAQWKTAWSDLMADALHKTCQNKGYEWVTKEYCEDLCPLRSYIEGLYT